MKIKKVIDTNPYLRDPKAMANGICRAIESSFAIENINVRVKATKRDGKYCFKSIVKPHHQK